jgi:threonylcarbamoyladenosine tRNA methylthiotransferase MtaB
MKTFSIKSLGCKVNHYESQQIREHLERLGLAQVDTGASPDLVVINTCCVTATASAKSRRCIRRTQRLNPRTLVLVYGCLPSMATHDLSRLGDRVMVVGNRRDLPTRLSDIAGNHGRPTGCDDTPSSPDTSIRPNGDPQIKSKTDSSLRGLPPLTRFEGQTRAFLKVQDGCNAFCTYCVVPLARPLLSSKPPEQACDEARALVAAGHQEIVVAGVCLGAYGRTAVRPDRGSQGQGPSLASLVDALARVPGLARIRLSSLHPSDVDAGLLEVIRRHPNIMPHLHLSLQSGSDHVLERMHRPYTTDDFRRVAAQVTSCLDRPALTTDVIVGFPGETDADFDQTMALAREVGFAKMHVFAFSPRKGTVAALLDDRVPGRVVQGRSRALRGLDRQLGRQFRGTFLGQTAHFLIEEVEPMPCGRSERYATVYVRQTSPPIQRNQIVSVTLMGHYRDGMTAEVRSKK